MTAAVSLAPSMPRAAAGLVGLHGLKQRWIAGTVQDGLRRDSAAWFAVGDHTPYEERHRTLAACVYHALGLSVVAELAEQPAPGGYRAVFMNRPDQTPAILGFSYEPCGQEVWRRYVWVGPPAPGVTAPYTKVARAGRVAGPWRYPRLFVPSLAQLTRIERVLDRHPPRLGDPRLARADDGGPVTSVNTKLARFCSAVADVAHAMLFPDQPRVGQRR